MTTTQRETLAQEIEERTKDAYSFPRYANWLACVRLLLERGYTEKQTEWILRSKWMRWAADGSTAGYGHVTSSDLACFLDTYDLSELPK